MLTVSGKVIDKDDFPYEMRRWAIEYTVNCTQQSFPCLVVKYYNHTRVWQLVGIFQLPTPAKKNSYHMEKWHFAYWEKFHLVELNIIVQNSSKTSKVKNFLVVFDEFCTIMTLCLFRSYALSRNLQLHQNFPQIPIQTKELGTSLSFICLYMSYLYVFPSFALSHYEAKYQVVRTNTNIIPVFVLWSTLVSCIENLSVCLITF